MFLKKNIHLTSHYEKDYEANMMENHCTNLRSHLENIISELTAAKNTIKNLKQTIKIGK